MGVGGRLHAPAALDGSGWSTTRPGHFTAGKDPVLRVKDAWWAPGRVWSVAELRTKL